MKTNLMDVLVLLLKAAVRRHGTPEIRLSKDDVMLAENQDLQMAKGLDGSVVLRLADGKDPQNTKIILPHGQNPLAIIE